MNMFVSVVLRFAPVLFGVASLHPHLGHTARVAFICLALTLSYAYGIMDERHRRAPVVSKTDR